MKIDEEFPGEKTTPPSEEENAFENTRWIEHGRVSADWMERVHPTLNGGVILESAL